MSAGNDLHGVLLPVVVQLRKPLSWGSRIDVDYCSVETENLAVISRTLAIARGWHMCQRAWASVRAESLRNL